MQQVSPNGHLSRFFVDFEEVRSWHDANKFVAQFALKRKQLPLSVDSSRLRANFRNHSVVIASSQRLDSCSSRCALGDGRSVRFPLEPRWLQVAPHNNNNSGTSGLLRIGLITSQDRELKENSHTCTSHVHDHTATNLSKHIW